MAGMTVLETWQTIYDEGNDRGYGRAAKEFAERVSPPPGALVWVRADVKWRSTQDIGEIARRISHQAELSVRVPVGADGKVGDVRSAFTQMLAATPGYVNVRVHEIEFADDSKVFLP
jgi:hypothetical protein